MSTEHSEVDMIFLGLTIHYVYLLTIWHLYNDSRVCVCVCVGVCVCVCVRASVRACVRACVLRACARALARARVRARACVRAWFLIMLLVLYTLCCYVMLSCCAYVQVGLVTGLRAFSTEQSKLVRQGFVSAYSNSPILSPYLFQYFKCFKMLCLIFSKIFYTIVVFIAISL